MSPRPALVTGSTRNIGEAIARRLASDGHPVVVTGRDGTAADAVAASIEDAGGRALGRRLDVRSQDSVERCVQAAETAFGPIGILVHSVGNRRHGPLSTMGEEDLADVMDVCVGGAFRCTRAVLDSMRSSGWGRVVHLIGVSGERGTAENVLGSTAKSGLIGFTKSTAREFAPYGITVNGLSPGVIDTQRGEWTVAGDPDELRERYANAVDDIPAGRMGSVDEIAAACSFLCADAASYITGQILAVNGGLYT